MILEVDGTTITEINDITGAFADLLESVHQEPNDILFDEDFQHKLN